MCVLWLFGKFAPFYPTLKGCRRFHSTHKAGHWTPPTSNPSNVLSVVLKTVENGGWLTAVARWHMRYLLRRISCRQCDRANGLCANPFALRHTVFVCSCASYCASFGTTVRHYHAPSAHAPSLSHTSVMPAPTPSTTTFHTLEMDNAIAMPVRTWAQILLTKVGSECLYRAQLTASDWVMR